MNEAIPNDIRLGLNLVLYEILSVEYSYLEDLPPFGEKEASYFSRFNENKIEKIGISLEWAEANSQFPFNESRPRLLRFDSDLISSFLNHTLNGLVNAGLYIRKGSNT